MPENNIVFPPIAGGFVDTSALTVGKVAENTRGCTATKTAVGALLIVTEESFAVGDIRAWVCFNENFPEGQCFILQAGPTQFVINIYGLGVDQGPPVALTATAAEGIVAFGIDRIPRR